MTSLTRGKQPGEHPALAELDRTAIGHVLLQDGDTSVPRGGRPSTVVGRLPLPLEHAPVTVVVIGLGRRQAAEELCACARACLCVRTCVCVRVHLCVCVYKNAYNVHAAACMRTHISMYARTQARTQARTYLGLSTCCFS